MATKQRRTRKKDWDKYCNSDSSEDGDTNDDCNSSDDNDTNDNIKALKKISYVKREKEKKRRKIIKQLNKLCNSDSDTEQQKHRPLLHKLQEKKEGKQEESSDSSSSKEFQVPKLKATNLSSIQDYSIISTPSKSDDENIIVNNKQEIILKNQIIEQVNKIQHLTSKLVEDLEFQSDYLIKKKVNVVRDSKFIAHKILRIYDETHKKLKENRNNFAESYKHWLEGCSKPVKKNTFRKISKLSSDDSEENQNVLSKTSNSKEVFTQDKKKKNKENPEKIIEDKKNSSIEKETQKKLNKLNKTNEDTLSENEASLKDPNSKNEHILDSEKNNSKSYNSEKFTNKEDIETEQRKIDNPNIVKEKLIKKKSSSEEQNKLENTDTDKTSKNNSSISMKVNNPNNDNISESHKDSAVEEEKNITMPELQENEVLKEVSDCDTDKIFSENESHDNVEESNIKAALVSKSNSATNEEMVVNNSQFTSSEELFETTASEVPNSPILSRKLQPSLIKNANEFQETVISNKEVESDLEQEISLSPVAEADVEQNALNTLLRECDSDPSNSNSNKDDSSDEDCKNKLKQKSNKLTKKQVQVPNQTKKRNSIYSDSSSDNSEEPDGRKFHRGKACRFASRKRRRLNLQNNQYYKSDEKLRMACRVTLKRLSQKVVEKHSKAFEDSMKYVQNKKFHSVTNLDNLEVKRKAKKQTDIAETSSEENTTNVNSKKKNDKKPVKTTLDEDNDIEFTDTSDTSDRNKFLSNDVSIDQEIIIESEDQAKNDLLHSCSNSSNDEVDENDEDSTKVKKISKSLKQSGKDNSEMDVSNEISEEEKIEKKDKSKWKQDKLLTFHVTDTESEEEKFKLSQEKKKIKENKKNDKSIEEEVSFEKSSSASPVKKKRKKRNTRRIVESDSDAKISSDEEDSEISGDEVEEIKEEKKKKPTKRRKKSSDSDTSSSDKKTKSKRKRIKKVATDSDSDNQDGSGKGRKNIRKVLKDKHVADDTKKAAQDEEERLKRIAERQRLFNEMYDARLAGEAKVEKLVLDFDEETKQELVVVNNELVKRLKPHQAKGIKFMWDACFESLKQIEKSEGSGCIIAHCMGLGKTFQVVTLAHTLLTHEKTGVNTVMIVCPLSTVLNWVNEFKIWLKHVKDGDEIEIYELTKMKKNIERKYQLESWQKTGGVLIIGYEMFRNLTSTGKKMRKAMQESVMRSLVDPGADLVVCDEGHLLKNEDSALSKAMKLVKTLRRIVLTGTPLQNNLKEYHCMVQFVKPNLLGTKKEFLNRFVNPITNGQFDDSTPYDVKLMKKRAHVLHKMLEGSVQRFDYSVLTPFLPPKQEYVIFVRLTEIQIKMYQFYLDNFSRRFGQRNGSLFADFQELQRIWTHPYVLRLNAEKVDKANEKKRLEASDSEGSLKDFIDDDESELETSMSSTSSNNDSNDDVQYLDSDGEKKNVKPARSTRLNPKDEVLEVPIPQETAEEAAWWSKFVEEEHFHDLRISTKLVLLFSILRESEQIGDKVLVFSQSLYSLTLIEHFLDLIDQETQNGGEAEHLDKHSGNWSLGLDYFRLDGSTSAENRSAWCKIFNNPKNTRARLFLISTRAGGLGINLTAANRVIIFDASWNPSHDVQSIFRIYRFGQKKPCYIYRFLAAGTMEEKIYNRQVTKLSLACRVVDEQQIERHYSNNDLAELYQFESYEGKSIQLNLPKDRLLAEIFLKYKDAVYTYHEHDSLLENKEEEELDEEERKLAWLEYEEEKEGKRQIMSNNMGFNPMFMGANTLPSLEQIKLTIQNQYPHVPVDHIESLARQIMFDMYRTVDQQAVNQTLNPFGQAMQHVNMFGASMQSMQQPQQYNEQNQLINMLNQPQVNYPNANQMPSYPGRGRPPKHLTMNDPLANARSMQMQQMQQPQMQRMANNDDVQIMPDSQAATQNNDSSSDNNKRE